MPADDDVRDDSADLERSLGDQFGRTRASFSRLISAHINLLRAEIGQIVGQLKMMATLGGIALMLLLTMANMLYIGGFLFTGEWLFGSIGWGLAQGVFFALSLALVLLLAMLGGSIGMAILAVMVSIVFMVLLAVALGTNAAYNTAAYVAGQLVWPLNSAPAIGAIGGLVIGGLLMAILLARIAGRGGAVGGFVLGTLIGAILGIVVGSAPWTWPPAMGFAITIGLIFWPIINLSLTWPGLDVGAYFSRLYPKETIETVTETREWLQNELQSRLPTRGKK